jgi:DNA-binding XRE family transcriptional regulator
MRRSGKVPGLNRLQDAQGFVSATASLFDDWPRVFNSLLLKLQSASAGSTSIQRTFSPLYRILYKELRSADFDFMRGAFEAFLHEHWWGSLCRRNRRLGDSAVRNHPRVTTSQAAVMAGISPTTLIHMVQGDLLSSESASFPSGKQVRTLHVDEVRVAATAAHAACTLAESAKVLALPESRVRQLIDAGTISTLISRRTCSTAAKWLIPAEELKAVNTFSASDCGRDVVTLRRFLRYEGVDSGEVASLVAQVKCGALRALGGAARDVPLGEVLLDRMEARAWLAEYRGEADMSIDEAGRRLGVKQQVMYALARSGLLMTDVDAEGRRRVTPDGLVSFRERYISLSAVASGLGTSPKAALRRIQARPVCGPGIDANRQYFYRLGEIENVRDR